MYKFKNLNDVKQCVTYLTYILFEQILYNLFHMKTDQVIIFGFLMCAFI